MIKFDLEKAKAGKKLVTRNGHDARFICDDLKGRYPICSVIEVDSGNEYPFTFTIEGVYRRGCSDELDLFMSEETEKKEGWINLYKEDDGIYGCKIYPSKKEAERYSNCPGNITTTKIEWEE